MIKTHLNVIDPAKNVSFIKYSLSELLFFEYSFYLRFNQYKLVLRFDFVVNTKMSFTKDFMNKFIECRFDFISS
jgi:hypothetical protein